MILLYELQKRLANLRPTTTVVTTPTGTRYIERRQSFGNGEHHQEKEQLEARQYGFVVDTKPDTMPACILSDFLYLGSQDAVNLENVFKYKLTHILSIGIESPTIELPSNLTLKSKYLPCLDLPETDIINYIMPVSIQFIEDARQSGCGRVLVHCNAGVSRSASIVIGYLMKQRDMSFDDAYNLVKSWRPCIQPNVGFMQQLKKYNNREKVVSSKHV